MVDSNSKGSRRERQLRNYFREKDGYVCIRIPSSGAGTDMDLPDLLVGGDALREPLAIELKSGKENNLYVDAEEAEDLKSFASAFGAEPTLAARWDGDTNFYYRSVWNVPTTDGGNYRLNPESAREQWAWWEQP